MGVLVVHTLRDSDRNGYNATEKNGSVFLDTNTRNGVAQCLEVLSIHTALSQDTQRRTITSRYLSYVAFCL